MQFSGAWGAASEKVVIHLIKVKCLPVLLYHGTYACPTNTTDLRSLEFAVKRVMIKLFCTDNNTVISSCMSFFGFPSVTDFIDQRRSKFFSKFNASDNMLCCACKS